MPSRINGCLCPASTKYHPGHLARFYILLTAESLGPRGKPDAKDHSPFTLAVFRVRSAPQFVI